MLVPVSPQVHFFCTSVNILSDIIKYCSKSPVNKMELNVTILIDGLDNYANPELC